MKHALSLVTCVLLCACASAPVGRGVARAHAERGARVCTQQAWLAVPPRPPSTRSHPARRLHQPPPSPTPDIGAIGRECQ